MRTRVWCYIDCVNDPRGYHPETATTHDWCRLTITSSHYGVRGTDHCPSGTEGVTTLGLPLLKDSRSTSVVGAESKHWTLLLTLFSFGSKVYRRTKKSLHYRKKGPFLYIRNVTLAKSEIRKLQFRCVFSQIPKGRSPTGVLCLGWDILSFVCQTP